MAEPPTKETLELVLKTVKETRERWKGHPEYVRYLDAEIYALNLALHEERSGL
jgi:hypothetical protein